jgi:hypothetical protein
VRVLVAAQRLRAVELALAVGAREGAVRLGGDGDPRQVAVPVLAGVDEAQVEVDVVIGRLLFHGRISWWRGGARAKWR